MTIGKVTGNGSEQQPGGTGREQHQSNKSGPTGVKGKPCRKNDTYADEEKGS
nr:hypothetical protein [Burkholderia cepacia]